MYFVYILLNKEGGRYIGMTGDLKQRMKNHKNNNVESTKHAEYKKAWHCAFRDKEKAREFEKYLKSSSGHAFTNKRLL